MCEMPNNYVAKFFFIVCNRKTEHKMTTTKNRLAREQNKTKYVENEIHISPQIYIVWNTHNNDMNTSQALLFDVI